MDSIRVHLILPFIPTEISITLFMIFGEQDKGDQSRVRPNYTRQITKAGHIS